MKKLFAFVLAFTLVAATAVPALAEDNTTASVTGDNKSASIPVKGSYKGPGDVISVDVVWDAMNFTYAEDNVGTWNPTTHNYDNPTTAGWSWNKPESETKTAPEIKLTNHSNVRVKAEFGFTANTEISGLKGNFTNLTDDGTFTLVTAVGKKVNEAPSNSTAFSLEGNGITGKDVPLGEITVKISKDDTTPTTPTVTEVGDAAALQTAIQSGNESIKLTDDITVPSAVGTALAVENYTGTIDLNEHTLTISDSVQMQIIDSKDVTINNGTVKGSYADFVYIKNAAVTMNNCKIENSDDSTTMHVMSVSTDSTVYLNDCTLTSSHNAQALEVDGGNVTLSGDTTLTCTNAAAPVEVKNNGTLTCLEGYYNFDPKAYVDTDNYTIGQNHMIDPSTGETSYTVWTVTSKE